MFGMPAPVRDRHPEGGSRPVAHPGRRATRCRVTGILAAAVTAVACVAMAGCASELRKVSHDVKANRATIDRFAKTLNRSDNKRFEATYVTTGGAPATIVYAADPPKYLALTYTPTGSGSRRAVIVNTKGEYECSKTSPRRNWTCKRAGSADTAVRNKLLTIYTPSHWVGFLKGIAIASGLAGDTVTTSRQVTDGFTLRCVQVHTPAQQGPVKLCTTTTGVLGLVQLDTGATSFKIKSYRSVPPPSLFRLPPGTKVT
jgi:hypothetical protein